MLLAPTRHGHDRVPAPAAPDRGEPVRHHLSRALLLLVVHDGRAGSSRTHGLRMFDVEELPTHGGSLRIYARHADDPRPDHAARCAICCRARRRRAMRTSRPTRLRRAGRGDQAGAARVPDRGQARRQAHRRLRRAGQGQHAAELLRHPHRLPRLHRRPQPAQAGQVPARHAHPDPRPVEDPRDEARLHPDPAVEPREGDHAQLPHVREWGGQFVVPIPTATVLP